MGFGKIKKEVEASGLDPQVAHSNLTVDGRLVSVEASPTTVSAYYEPEKLKEILATYPQVDGVPQVAYEQFVIAEPSDLAKKVLEAANEGLVEEVSELHNKGIPLHGLDADGNLVTEEPEQEQVEETEPVEESPKADSKVKEKKVPTKKKPTKK